MTERERIILSLSNAELLMFHAIGGTITPAQFGRLTDELAAVERERKRKVPKQTARVSWSARAVKKRREWAAARKRRRQEAKARRHMRIAA